MDRLRLRILDHLAGSYYKYGTRPWNSLRYGKPRECDPALSFINNLKVQGAPLEETKRRGRGTRFGKNACVPFPPPLSPPLRVGNRLTESSAQHRPLLCFPPVVLSLTKRTYRKVPFSPLCNTFDGRAFRVGNPSPVSVANSLLTFIRKYYVTKRENES